MSEASEHVDPARLIECAQGRLDATAAKLVEQHVERCGTCSAEMALARRYIETSVGARVEGRSESLKGAFSVRLAERLNSEAAQSHQPIHAPRRGISGRWLSRGLLAASIAVIGFGLLQMRSSTRPGDDELGRQMRSEEAANPLELTVRAADRGPWGLSWTTPTGVRDLRLRVIAADGSLVLERAVDEGPLLLDPSELGVDANATGLLIQLSGTGPSGETLRSVPQRLPAGP